MRKVLEIIVITAVAALSHHQHQVHAESLANKVLSSLVQLPIFSLELRSQENPQSYQETSIALKNITQTHLDNFIQELDNNKWDGFQSILLNQKQIVIEEIKQGSSLLRSRRRNLASSSIYSLKATFTGSMIFLDVIATSKPGENDIETMIQDAFIGQAKLDYLGLVQNSNDTFLSSSNNAVVSDISSNDNDIETKTKKSPLLLIISIIVAVGSIVGVLTAYYFLCYNRNEQNENDEDAFSKGGREKTKKGINKQRKSSKNDTIADLQLVPTASMSPPCSPPVRSSSRAGKLRKQDSNSSTASSKGRGPESIKRSHKSTSMGHKSIKSSYKSTSRGPGSVKSKDTIDINGSFDMIAWKNKRSGDIPFETDLTMISATSPNKTMEVKVPREIRNKVHEYHRKNKGRKKRRSDEIRKHGQYLSKNVLSEYNTYKHEHNR